MRQMNYRRRTFLLIAVWILLFLFVSAATLYYGYSRSVEIARMTVRDSLTRVNESMEDMISNEVSIRRNYDLARANMGHIVKFLQDHGLEEDVPDQEHLKRYAELLEANYIRIVDPDGREAASYGELIEDRHTYEVTTEDDVIRWLTSGDSLVPPEEDVTLFREALKDDYILEYQILNDAANAVQNMTFSWRAILSDMKFANEAYLIVISGEDGTILVHPDESMIGKSYDALGIGSEKEFLELYKKPDSEGIAYQRSLFSLIGSDSGSSMSESEINLFGMGSGYMKMQGMYVICNMPDSMTGFYVGQQRGIRLIYGLVSFMVLCYILLYFRWKKNHGTDASEGGEVYTLSGLGLTCDRAWSRRLIAFCIIMLIVGSVMCVHAELLSNSSRAKIRAAQAAKLEKSIIRENERRRSVLDAWFNDTNMHTARVIAYALTRDEKLQNRKDLKELSALFDGTEIFIFDEDGRTRVTNSDIDHIDLNDNEPPRMCRTLLPLLHGISQNACTPLTDKMSYEASGSSEGSASDDTGAEDGAWYNTELEELMAYAGVSLRNSRDLCDGCLGISLESLKELWGKTEFNPNAVDTYDTALGLISEDGKTSTAITSSQLDLMVIVLLHLIVCFAAFYCIGVLQEKAGKETAAEADPEVTEVMTPEASEGSAQKNEDQFFILFGKHRDRSFHERWNRDTTPIGQRSPEKQLLFIARIILFVLFLWIVVVFITKGQYLDENSMIRDVVNGGWKKGMNLYAFTAAEMIIVVSAVLCMALHDLVYFIARFSTPRGETVCHLVYSFITYATVLVAIYYTLTVFGVHTSTILKGAGIMGLVITFGAQSTIADILSGIFLIFENVIHVGDFVSVGDVSGVVINIGVRMTKIQSFGTVISVNNSELKAMQNMSYADSRISSRIRIDNREDVSRLRKIIERELPSINARLRETGYTTTELRFGGISDIDECGMTLEFHVFSHPHHSVSVTRMLNEELISMFQRSGIRLAVNRSLIEADGEDTDQGTAENGESRTSE